MVSAKYFYSIPHAQGSLDAEHLCKKYQEYA